MRGLLPEPEIRKHLLRDDGEDIVVEVPHHWVAYVRSALLAGPGAFVFGLGLFVDIDVAWLFFLVGLGVVLYAGYLALSVHMDRFVVTNRRVFRVKGVFNKSTATMPLKRILDITAKKPFIGRFLGYGHFVFESAAQSQGLRDIRMIPHVDALDLIIQGVVQSSGVQGRGGDD